MIDMEGEQAYTVALLAPPPDEEHHISDRLLLVHQWAENAARAALLAKSETARMAEPRLEPDQLEVLAVFKGFIRDIRIARGT